MKDIVNTKIKFREPFRPQRLGIAGELLTFFWQNKWWWLTPLAACRLLLFGAFIVFVQGSAVAPFIYTLF
jgi:hypothetical protein